MFKLDKIRLWVMLLTGGLWGSMCSPAAADVRIEGQVQAGGAPLANSTVTLWAASAGEPRQLAQVKSGSDGRFQLLSQETPGTDVSLYLVARGGQATVNKGSGDNSAIALLTVLGNTPPGKVVINEMTTIASVWTNAQFLNGSAIKGPALSLRIAAGNVPNFVDVQTGGWGATIQDPLNGGQTPTMANFATLADVHCWLRHVGNCRCVRQAFHSGDTAEGSRPNRHTDSGPVHRSQSMVPATTAIRFVGPVLSGPEGREPASGSIYAVPQLVAERLGASAQV